MKETFVTFWRDLLSRDIFDLSRDNLDVSRDNFPFIARYKNVSSVSSMGHRTYERVDSALSNRDLGKQAENFA